MSVLDPFRKFFTEPDPKEEAISECNEIIEFSRMAYYPRLIAYLERGADEPLQTASEGAVIRSAERVNTFKEIKKYLQGQVRDAQAVLERERDDA